MLKSLFYTSLFLLCSFSLFAMQHDKIQAKTDVPTLTITLDQTAYHLPLRNALSHICNIHKVIEKNPRTQQLQETISGFHYYSDRKPQVEPHGDNGCFLVKISPVLWIYCIGNINTFHQGYVIYQGKLYDPPKTFFPANWTIADIINCLKKLTSFKVLGNRSTNLACEKLTVEARSSRADEPPFYLAVTRYPALAQSAHIVTVFPKLVQSDKKMANLKMLEVAQAKEIALLKKAELRVKHSTDSAEMQRMHSQQYKALCTAIESRDSVALTTLLQSGIDPNMVNIEGKTPLMEAFRLGTTENPYALDVINILLEHGADLSVQDKKENTVVHYAVMSENYFMVLAALSSRLVNKANKDGITPLMDAVMRRLLDITNLLASHAEETIDTTDNNGNTAVMLGCIDTMSKCRSADAPQRAAVIVSLLLGYKANPDGVNKAHNAPLHAAIISQCPLRVKTLLDAYADITIRNSRNQIPRELASSLKYDHIIALFDTQDSAKRAWLHEHAGNDLMYACFVGDERSVKRQIAASSLSPVISHAVASPVGTLLDQKTNFETNALWYAITNSHERIVQLLLDEGADPSIQIAGMTLAEYAQNDEFKLSDALKTRLLTQAYERQAPVRAKIEEEKREREALLKKVREQILRDILDDSALTALNQLKDKPYNGNGETIVQAVLFFAVKNSKHTAVKQILDMPGNHRNALNHEKQSTLLIAAGNGDVRMIELLSTHELRGNATLERISNQHTEACVHYACEQRKPDILNVLFQARPEIIVTVLERFLIKNECDKAQLLLSHLPSLTSYLQEKCAETERLFFDVVQAQSVHGIDILLQLLPSLIQARDEQGQTAFIRACQLDNEHLIRLLLSAGSDIQAQDNDGKVALEYVSVKSALYSFLRDHYEKMRQQTLAKNDVLQKEQKTAQLKEQGYTPLMIAVAVNDIDTMKQATLSDLQKTSPNGLTPLMIAAQQGNVPAIHALLDQFLVHGNKAAVSRDGSDRSRNKKNKQTAKNSRAESDNSEQKSASVRDMIVRHAIVNAQDDEGNTSLFYALQNGHEQAAHVLLNLGAGVLGSRGSKAAYALIRSRFNRQSELLTLVRHSIEQQLEDYMSELLILFNDEKLWNEEVSFIKTLDDVYILRIIGFLVQHEMVDKANELCKKCSIKQEKLILFLLDLLSELLAKRAKKASMQLLTAWAHEARFFKLCLEKDQDLALEFIRSISEGTSIRWKESEFKEIMQLIGNTQNSKLIIEFVKKVDVHTLSSVDGFKFLISKLPHEERNHLVELSFSQGVSVDKPDNKGNTYLHFACMSQMPFSAVELCLRSNADPNVANKQGVTPLLNACLSNSLEKVKALLSSPRLCADTIYNGSINAFLIACDCKNEEIPLALLQDERVCTDEFIHSHNWDLPLIVAAASGHSRVVEHLIKRGACVNGADKDSRYVGRTPLHGAASASNCEIVQRLLTAGANVNSTISSGILQGMTALHIASMNGSTDIVTLLIERGSSVDCQCTDGSHSGATPLWLAAFYGKKDVVQHLIRCGAQLTVRNDENVGPLHAAGQKNHAEIVKMLLDAMKEQGKLDASGDWLYVNGSSMLHHAAAHNAKETFQILLDFGCSINVPVKNEIKKGATPLYIAATVNQIEMVRFLLNRGAAINVSSTSKEQEGRTMLHDVAQQGNIPLVKLLLERGAQVNAKHTGGPFKGITPLHDAAAKGHAEVICLLVQAGAAVDALSEGQEYRDASPLHIAIQNNKPAAVRELIACGANTRLPMPVHDGKDVNMLHYAAKQNYLEIAQILLSSGNNPLPCLRDNNSKLPADYARSREMKALFARNCVPVRNTDLNKQSQL